LRKTKGIELDMRMTKGGYDKGVELDGMLH